MNKMLVQTVWVSLNGDLFFKKERDCKFDDEVDQLIMDTKIEFPDMPADCQLIVCTSDSPIFLHSLNPMDKPI